MNNEKTIWKAAGKRLAAARINAGYSSQKALAAAYGVSDPTIAKYEQGAREIPISLLHWFSERHGVNADWIITGKGEIFGVDASSLTGPAALLVADFNRLPKNRQEEVLDITSMIAERHGL